MTNILVPVNVEIKPWEDRSGCSDVKGFCVSPIWADVDRPNVGGIVVRSQSLANRLKRAYLAGVVFSATEIRTDQWGQTYVCTSSKVMGKYVNADLKRLGF